MRNALIVVSVVSVGCTTINGHENKDAGPVRVTSEDAAVRDAALPRCPVGGGPLEFAFLRELGLELSLPAKPTTNVRLAINYDMGAAIPGAPFDVTSPSATANFPTAVSVYDSRGNHHQITVYSARTGSETWDWHALAEGNQVVGGVAGGLSESASGTISFSTDGALQTEVMNSSRWTFLDAAPQEIHFDFGTSLDEHGTGRDGSVSSTSSFVTNDVQQDGYAAGTLASANADASGSIVGVFSNGQTQTIGRCP